MPYREVLAHYHDISTFSNHDTLTFSRHPKNVELKLGFIGGKAEGPDGKVQFTSLHGQTEVDENVRQICARDLFPGKWLDYVLERNKNVKGAEWQPSAEKAGLDAKAVDAGPACPSRYRPAGPESWPTAKAFARGRDAASRPG